MTDQARQPGYYWVKFEAQADWEAAEWDPYPYAPGVWRRSGDDDPYLSSDLTEIDERRIERQPEARAIENAVLHISKFGPW